MILGVLDLKLWEAREIYREHAVSGIKLITYRLARHTFSLNLGLAALLLQLLF